MRLRKQDLRYQPVPRFPSSAFDLSVVVPAQALVGDIRRQIAGFAETDAVEYVRQYSGPPLPDGTKSVSYRITVSAPDRTLSSDEVSTVRQRVITGMRGLGHDLRV
jgi:phenylalanyl-tRNA synthetase beta chain